MTEASEIADLASDLKDKPTKGVACPVLFIVFNRPKLTRWVFQSIRKARPARLYIAADGPRRSVPEDQAKCKAVREIVSEIDWPCNVNRLFQEENLGCRRAVSAAIDWFFSQEEEGIILEDDILPEPGFFHFCAKMLEAHREDTQVMQVSGYNVLPIKETTERDYFFSKFGTIWGWATWKRAWRHYHVDMDDWQDHKKAVLNHFPKKLWKQRLELYRKLAKNEIDTWDYQWTFWRLAHQGLSIVPENNLVRNIGFGSDATHTTKAPKWLNNQTLPLNTERLRLNGLVEFDQRYDQYFLEIAHPPKPAQPSLFTRVWRLLFSRPDLPVRPMAPVQKDWTSTLPRKVEFIGGMPPHFSMGRGTYANGLKVYGWDPTIRVSFGKYCAVADLVVVIAGGEHDKDWVSSYQFIDLWNVWELQKRLKPRYKGDIHIGHDVWIGSGALIISGVRIGNGAVVAAGSVVVKDVPPYAIVGGNPAKVIRYRFTEYQIEALEKLAWWDWSEEKVREFLPLMHDVDQFIQTAMDL